MSFSEFTNSKRDNIDLVVYHCGMENCKPSHEFGPAVRDHFLIHYVLDGNGTFYTENKEYKLGKKDGFLICPNSVTYYRADRENPWSYAWIGFYGMKAEKYLKYANLNIANPIFRYSKDDALEKYLTEMLRCNKMTKSHQLKLQGLLNLFLSELIENSKENEKRNDGNAENDKNQKDIYIRKLIEYIDMNYSRNIKISEAADYLGLNRSYLSTIFTEKLKVSPKEFIIKYRVDKACELMNNSSLSISQISRSVGYEDPLAFSKIFKKHRGDSPKEFRRKNFNENSGEKNSRGKNSRDSSHNCSGEIVGEKT